MITAKLTSGHSLPPLKPLSHEQLRARAALKSRKPNGLGTMSSLFAKAYAEAGIQPPAAPKPAPRWQWSEKNAMVWSCASFGSVKIQVHKHDLGKIEEHGINSWAPIEVKGEPQFLLFRITHKLVSGTRILCGQKGQIIDDLTGKDEPRHFEVACNWDKHKPHTRGEKGDYDFSIVVIDSEGVFIELEIAVTTRNNRFWLSVQEKWAAQVARTTSAKADQLGFTTLESENGVIALAAPLYAENSRPGADFLKSGGMMHGVIEYCIEHGLSKPLSKCSLGKWDPIPAVLPEEMAKDGWVLGTVSFFSFSWGGGSGHVAYGNGQSAYVHFSGIVDAEGVPLSDKGEFPVIHPMTQVALKLGTDPKGKPDNKVRTL